MISNFATRPAVLFYRLLFRNIATMCEYDFVHVLHVGRTSAACHASIRVHLHATVNKRQPKHPTAADMQLENHQTFMSPIHTHAHTQYFSEPPRLPQAHRPPVAPLLLRSNHQSARTPSSRPMPQSSTRTQRQPFQCSAGDDDSQPHIRWRRRHLNRNERTNVTSHKSLFFPRRDPSGAAEIKIG
ncbi:hypothetical protein BKA56DRAFT_357812 [Ilyonectria sp. MPI-CAGE-AT-0026]|nr:hypothetical protein BKA56DRAFT_357812 [Ilyonectria sp. MPI-CAGE-AT-0026]